MSVFKQDKYQKNGQNVSLTPSQSLQPMIGEIPCRIGVLLLPRPLIYLFCGILNNRLIKWAEINEILADEQNGFRKDRSTINHISSITNRDTDRHRRCLGGAFMISLVNTMVTWLVY